MIYVLSGGVTNVAGVVRVSYPANSTLVVKGTSSGKQFAKDTNTTSSAKAYIFLAPIGNASYTLTATNSAGKTVSKQVYVAKDQVQSVTLAYFSATISITYPAASICVVTDSDGTTVATDTNGDSSAKTWTVTVGAAGTYIITATNADGSKSNSENVSITADGQSVSAVLAYDYVIFDDATGLNATYSDGGGGAKVTVSTSGGVKVLKFPHGGGYNRMAYLKPAVDLTEFNTLKISAFASADRKFAVWKSVPDSDNNGMSASVVIKQGTSPSSYAIDVSKLSGSYYLGTQYATADTTVYDLRFEY